MQNTSPVIRQRTFCWMLIAFVVFLLLKANLSSSQVKMKGGGSQKVMRKQIAGDYLEAFLVAYKDFSTSRGIPDNKRNLENYTLEFGEESENFVVHFHAKKRAEKLMDSKSVTLGGSTKNAVEVKYTINKSSYKIVQKLFYC